MVLPSLVEDSRSAHTTLLSPAFAQLYPIMELSAGPLRRLTRHVQVLVLQISYARREAEAEQVTESATRPVQGEIARQRELREKLAALEPEAQPRTTPITPLPVDPAQAWPAGITLDAPGTLTIRFSSSEELLGAVLALAEDAAANYESFAARLIQQAAEGRKEPDVPPETSTSLS